MKRRIIVILTCIVMVVAFMPAVTFAATSTGIKYVSLGDASAAGYGMANSVGYNKVAAGAYPALIRDAFKARNGSATLSQLAMEKMRTEELLYMLDDEYKAYGGDSYFKSNFGDKVTDAMRTKYQTSIKNADVITYALGSVNVGSYFLYIAEDVDGRCDDPAVKALVEADADGIRTSFNQAVDDILKGINEDVKKAAKRFGLDIDSMVAEYRDKYVDAAAYAYYSFCSSYDKTIAKIKELNKKATIIVFGVRNMLGDLAVKAQNEMLGLDLTIPAGALYDNNLIKKVNAHMQKTSGIKFISTSNVKTFLDEVYAYQGGSANVSAQFKRYCDVLEDDLQLKSDVTNYVKGKYTFGVDKRINWGMKGVYDTVASCLKEIAKLNNGTVSLSDLMYLGEKENIEKIASAGKNLMAQLRNQSLKDAKTAADKKGLSFYKEDLGNYKAGSLYKTGDVPESFGKIIMAAGIRSEMGGGFFLHPSAAGHKQISNTILNYLYPAKTSIVKLTPAKKAMTVKWKKPSAANLKNTTGYQLRYSLKSSMKSAKTVTIAKKATVSKKITKLKAKKKYYVQVRTYKQVNGKKYFSTWSEKKAKKTK